MFTLAGCGGHAPHGPVFGGGQLLHTAPDPGAVIGVTVGEAWLISTDLSGGAGEWSILRWRTTGSAGGWTVTTAPATRQAANTAATTCRMSRPSASMSSIHFP
ncbi:MAG TPA: hypothetical protein VKW09_03235 [bacterium]|nr:hypothetical protein [bacterium]